MNASGRPNTCKTSGKLFSNDNESVVRVRNTYAIYPKLEYSSAKAGLTLHKITEWHHLVIKTQVVLDEHADD